jgi:ABC-type multidrug transport system permease subunit
MKNVFIWLLTIITFILMLPISFFFLGLLIIIQQGQVNSIFQFIILLILSFTCSILVAKNLHTKLKNIMLK